jgi:hypothetical protein
MWVDRIRSPLGWTTVMDALLVVCDVVADGMTSEGGRVNEGSIM